MGDAVVAVVDAAADADDAHGKPVQRRAVADELVGPHDREARDRVDERDESGLGQPRGEPDHVLLGDADVEEAARMALREALRAP